MIICNENDSAVFRKIQMVVALLGNLMSQISCNFLLTIFQLSIKIERWRFIKMKLGLFCESKRQSWLISEWWSTDQQLVDGHCSFYVVFLLPNWILQVYIVGVPADCAKKRTRIIEDDWAPVWDEEFTYPLTVPELALLRIEVREYDRSEKDDFGGQTCLPVSELKPGFRAVPLYNKKGVKYNSVKLLVRFQFV